MLNEFKQYLLGIGKSENTALNYCDKVKLYFKWCLDKKVIWRCEKGHEWEAAVKILSPKFVHQSCGRS